MMRTQSTALGSLVSEPGLGPVYGVQTQQNIVFTWETALDIISSDVAMLCDNPTGEGAGVDLSPILHCPLSPAKLLPQRAEN